MADFPLLHLTAQYPILCALANNLSKYDMLNLALGCRTLHSRIRPSQQFFDALTKGGPCDGRGLLKRQEFSDLYHIDYMSRPYLRNIRKGNPYRPIKDEPVEVKLWALTCKDVDSKPCIKCGINVCDNCRYLDREALKSGCLGRKPFPASDWAHSNYMALCPDCDDKMEASLERQGQLGSSCDCDTYTRWICLKCHRAEDEYYERYRKTKIYHHNIDLLPAQSKCFWYPSSLEMWCWCGESVPDSTLTRCTWCMRRHPAEDEFRQVILAMEQDRQNGDYLEFDPCYPAYHEQQEGYPKLAYDGPIWSEAERKDFIARRANDTSP